MGFGPTSATILLGTGLSPASTSAAVNLAKTGTGFVAGLAHWRFENIDRRLTTTLAVPGAIGAIVGVALLSSVDTELLRPAIALLLCGIGVRILHRFGSGRPPRMRATTATPGSIDWTTAGAGAVGGCTNGLIGAWGPVVTPFLIQRGVPVHIAVGSANTAEIAVAVVSVGALMRSGTGGAELGIAIPMLAGGVVAAPLAANLVRRIPPRVAGLSLAAFLLLSQLRELAAAFDVGSARWLGYGAVAAAVAVSVRPRRPARPRAAARRRARLRSPAARE
jgi:uncharacterized protein